VFLKEEKKLSFSTIAELLNRDPRTVWNIYQNACNKLGTNFYVHAKRNIPIPLSALCNRKLGMMEAAVFYLKKNGLRNKEIANALDRAERTISSLLVRLRKRGDIK